jgi:hypothetical protein
MTPKSLGKLNTRGQPWKLPLDEYIDELYLERFKRARPEEVLSIEERAKRQAAKKAEARARKRERARDSDVG